MVPKLAALMTALAFAGAVIGSLLMVQHALLVSGVIGADGVTPVTAWIGGLIAIPIVAIVSLIIASAVGVVAALHDRVFSFRRLYACTAAVTAGMLLVSAIGVWDVFVSHAQTTTVLAGATLINLVLLVAYGRGLVRIAGVTRRAAIAVTAIWGSLLLISLMLGLIRG
ncbi:hypothetical protein [Microbacterium sp.]|uniref:hypothetical protein n=1 Tax=Microbacterium sp. TaxID=51671 RepID=UPI003A8B189E